MSNLPSYLKDLRARLDRIGGNLKPAAKVEPPPPRPPTVAARVSVPPKRKPAEGARQPPPPIVVPPRRRYVLRESWYSRRRLRYLIIPLALLLLLAISGAAWYFNNSYKMKRYADATVQKMRNASSYRAVGRDAMTDARAITTVKEQFSFVAPDSVRTHYLTTSQQPGMDAERGNINIDCADKEIAVLGNTRYQRCNDPDTLVKGWGTDNYDPSVFDTPLFQPWVRFLWCETIHEQKDEKLTTAIPGVKTRVFSCTVKNELEASTIWERTGKGLTDQATLARERFLTEAKVDITVWVREEDGYFARFAMVKTAPGTLGESKEEIDYVYSDFNQVPPIEPPSDSNGKGGAQEFTTAIINGRAFRLEVADTDEERARGLQNRTSLDTGAAMLFVYPQEQVLEFWMKNVNFPLDVIFLDGDKRVIDIQNMERQPGVPDANLRIYRSKAPAQYALEIYGGLAVQHGFRVGALVDLR